MCSNFTFGNFLATFERRVHEAERGGEDQAAAGARQALDHALGVGTFLDVLDIVLASTLSPSSFCHVLTADVVLLAEAAVIVRAGIDPARLQLAGRLGAAQRPRPATLPLPAATRNLRILSTPLV